MPTFGERLLSLFASGGKLNREWPAKNDNIQWRTNLSPNVGIQGDGGLCMSASLRVVINDCKLV